ncbi:hypothetical protein [Anaeromyxobacter sp. PSR-1]|uniref:hypothetical protein n=1 Tax=unclassified Anaeromyxobacter TaxID=2620896 RepID=UPI0005E84AA5|nr:hypothetical protein [Anaeromyxobacter sp. PSR-1]GAO02731.1 hypothetical protein PSR1_01604 [Anaeromyxobacter sp. PSR-1]
MTRSLVALAAAPAASAARASGDSGTASMGEMHMSGAQFGMMAGGLAVLGLVIWGVAKVTSR